LDKADLVLHSGTIFGCRGSDSVAIANGWIAAHGRFDDLKPLVGPRTHLIRLAGRVLMPGFIDCHLHFMEAASAAAGVSVERCRTIDELLNQLRSAAAKTAPGNWLRAFGCDEALMHDRRGPTREELDRAVAKNPLRLRHQTLHASWLNSRALNLLGLENSEARVPGGATVIREPSGRLSGLVVGMEEWLTNKLPRVTAAELEARARNYSRELAASGITAFTDATVRNGPAEVGAFIRLVATGAISQQTSVMIGPGHIGAVDELRPAAEAAGVRLAGVKFMDVARWEMTRLVGAIGEALARGLDCAFHSTEVEELEAILKAIAAARERLSPEALENIICRIEHGGLIPPGYPARIRALGIWVASNPGFLYYRGAKYASEPGLVNYLYRARSLAELGIPMAAGSDAPVTPAKPLHAIAAAVCRLSAEGYELAATEKILTKDALALFTTSAALLSRLSAGEIRPGYLANLIVLPANPLALKPAELINLPVDLTIVGGRVVFERGRPVIAHSAGESLPFA